jgi:hypothetical protein
MSLIKRLEGLARRLPHNRPELFWHGTSSLSLRSIMVNGLNPDKIQIGNWREDRENPSKISYGGIYYAKSMFTAYTYGTSISRKNPNSHPLLISVQLQELSAVPDEDMLGLNNLFFGFINQSEIKAAEIFVMLITRTTLKWYGGSVSWFKYIEDFRKQAMETIGLTTEQLNKRADSKRVLGAIDAALLICCKRYLAHVQQRGSYQDAYYYIRKALWDYAPKIAKQYTVETPGGTTLKLPAKFRLPTPAQAEQAAAQSLDYVITLTRHANITKNRTGDNWRRNNRTIRTKQAVGFRGRNKITCIMEFIDETGRYSPAEKIERIKIHYGNPPEEFVKEYRERISEKTPIIWLDKSGKEIKPHLSNLASEYQFNSDAGELNMPGESENPGVFWTGVEPGNADEDFSDIPGQLGDDIAETMDLEKFAGEIGCSVLTARLLHMSGKIKPLVVVAFESQSPLHGDFGVLGFKHEKDTRREGGLSNEKHHHYVGGAQLNHVHNYLTHMGYKRRTKGETHNMYTRENDPTEEVRVHHDGTTAYKIVHVITPKKMAAKNENKLDAAHAHLLSQGYKLHEQKPAGDENGESSRIYKHTTRPDDYVHVTHIGQNVTSAFHVKQPHSDKKPATARVSPIKGHHAYTWYIYHHTKPTTVTNKRGTKTVVLQRGSHFGIRKATSEPEKMRMIHEHTGKTIVFSLTKHHATRLINHSKPRKKR